MTCKGQIMTKDVHEFKTIQAIADELNIKRQTLYNRAKKTGIDISKRSFTDEEWSSLVNNKKLTSVNDEDDKKLTEIDTLREQISEQRHFIEILKKELDAKNQQIDQAQMLQLMSERKLSEVSSKDMIEMDVPHKETKNSFFSKWFKR